MAPSINDFIGYQTQDTKSTGLSFEQWLNQLDSILHSHIGKTTPTLIAIGIGTGATTTNPQCGGLKKLFVANYHKASTTPGNTTTTLPKPNTKQHSTE